MASICCTSGLWSPVAAVRGVWIEGCRNSGAPAGLGAGRGLVLARKDFGSVGKESNRLWHRVPCGSSNSQATRLPRQLALGSNVFCSRKELARVIGANAGRLPVSNGLSSEFSSLEVVPGERVTDSSVPALAVALVASTLYPDSANANTLNPAYADVGALLEAGVQLIYLGALLILLGVGSFLVVRQVLIKRELETAAKDLQDRVRSGEASSLEYFELGAVMLRKKYYQLANKYLDQAIKKWDGSEQDLAQVYNALGFSYFSDGKLEKAIAQYEKAVQLQPGYVTAWNNLADAYENQKDFAKALQAYEQALQLDPTNKVASARRESMKSKVDRFQGIP
ncbi:hypothetical protein MPTK1_2g07550 [Marchantia polymorpha subsp. ruderalis]|nr:hypothetical protein MARPO_0015s0041 [Marchantia polymorpha]BBN01459.1 hypothetical protein Mp_2g07550 [Marchantia polymorpha subsp. ruderalis]|eukprot:PTQ45226.1 hypothetical protein MARPO_0015s0041 [Marchantia polymorpha]